jgi:hypothetical protein
MKPGCDLPELRSAQRRLVPGSLTPSIDVRAL